MNREYHNSICTFDVILCSGLTEKTRLSFISSNSSFSECSNHHSSHFLLPNSQSQCEPDCQNIPFGTERITLSEAIEYKFTSCTWNKAIGNPSGAISLSKPGSSLTVSACHFIQCNSTSSAPSLSQASLGGAIGVFGIKSFKVDSSQFINCCSPYNKSNNADAGGICMNAVTTTISIINSDFIACFTGSSGAGFLMLFCTANSNSRTVQNCRFLSNLASGESPDGAAAMLFSNSGHPGFVDCIFSHSEAYYGGALYLGYRTFPSGVTFVNFCFFNANKGDTGNDIAISIPNMPTYDTPLFQGCFSTSDSNRVGYFDTNWHTYDFNWLPLTTINTDPLLA